MAVHDVGVLGLLLDDAGVDKIAHEHGCAFVVVSLLLHLRHLLLQLVEPRELGSDIILVVELGLLLVLDLLLGSSSLRAGLEHVDAAAVQN